MLVLQALLGLLSATAESKPSPHQASRTSMAQRSLGCLSRALQSAGMALIAASFDFVTRVFEFLAFGRELVQFGAAALRQDGVAGIAVVGFDGPFAVEMLLRGTLSIHSSPSLIGAQAKYMVG